MPSFASSIACSIAQWAKRPFGAMDRIVSRLMEYLPGHFQSSGSLESVKKSLIVPSTLHGISGF